MVAESGIQNWLNQVILALGLSWGCSQDVGCSHLKAWMGLRGSLPRYCTNMAVGRGPQSLDMWPSHRVPAWMSSSYGLWFPPGWVILERKVDTAVSLWPTSPEVILHHFHYILFARNKPLRTAHLKARGIRFGWAEEYWGICGHTLKLPLGLEYTILKCIIWLSTSGEEPKVLHFEHAHSWQHCCWSWTTFESRENHICKEW